MPQSEGDVQNENIITNGRNVLKTKQKPGPVLHVTLRWVELRDITQSHEKKKKKKNAI